MLSTSIKTTIISKLRSLDQKTACYKLRTLGEKNGLIILLFHSLFANRAEIRANAVAPQQGITVGQFRQIIAYYLEEGYTFVSAEDIAAGLRPDGKYVLLTFDDGYFNNTRAIPALDEYGVPALFFVSTRHVMNQKLFWWDALHREASRSGADLAEVQRYKSRLKAKKTADIEAILQEQFGPDSLDPTCDTDRPLTRDELRDFARERWVSIGNHTADHAILTNYSPEEVRGQIRECQAVLERETGSLPICISYPNGNHSDAIARIAQSEELALGITGITGKNYLPVMFDGLCEMKLRRMVPYGIYGDESLIEQCASFRTDGSLYGAAKNLFTGASF